MNGEAVKAARKSLGLTQEQMAAMLGYGSKVRVSEVERSKSDLDAGKARLLAAYLEGYRPKDWPLD